MNVLSPNYINDVVRSMVDDKSFKPNSWDELWMLNKPFMGVWCDNNLVYIVDPSNDYDILWNLGFPYNTSFVYVEDEEDTDSI